MQDAQGNLFGTANQGGANGVGMVWELAAGSSTITALASFDEANGALPQAALALDAQGNLFSTTSLGGANGLGTVFELSPVPEPASLVLLGTGLLGTLGAGWLRHGPVGRVLLRELRVPLPLGVAGRPVPDGG